MNYRDGGYGGWHGDGHSAERRRVLTRVGPNIQQLSTIVSFKQVGQIDIIVRPVSWHLGTCAELTFVIRCEKQTVSNVGDGNGPRAMGLYPGCVWDGALEKDQATKPTEYLFEGPRVNEFSIFVDGVSGNYLLEAEGATQPVDSLSSPDISWPGEIAASQSRLVCNSTSYAPLVEIPQIWAPNDPYDTNNPINFTGRPLCPILHAPILFNGSGAISRYNVGLPWGVASPSIMAPLIVKELSMPLNVTSDPPPVDVTAEYVLRYVAAWENLVPRWPDFGHDKEKLFLKMDAATRVYRLGQPLKEIDFMIGATSMRRAQVYEEHRVTILLHGGA